MEYVGRPETDSHIFMVKMALQYKGNSCMVLGHLGIHMENEETCFLSHIMQKST